MNVFEHFRGNPPVSATVLDGFEEQSELTLPKDYVQFLRHFNGGEGFIGKSAYVILWRLEELLEMNEAYEVSAHAPGLLLFGSDGGGEAFAFDMRFGSNSVVSVPFVGMDLTLVRKMASDFDEFLRELHKS